MITTTDRWRANGVVTSVPLVTSITFLSYVTFSFYRRASVEHAAAMTTSVVTPDVEETPTLWEETRSQGGVVFVSHGEGGRNLPLDVSCSLTLRIMGCVSIPAALPGATITASVMFTLALLVCDATRRICDVLTLCVVWCAMKRQRLPTVGRGGCGPTRSSTTQVVV